MKRIDAIFSALERENPNPKSELYSVNDFTFLVAVVLSAQMTDKGVNKATKLLFERVKTPEDVVALGEERLAESIKSVNFYKTKARNVIKIAEFVMQNGLPKEFDTLIKLNGVGRKTANVFLNAVYGAGRIGVDTHVARVSRRLGLAKSTRPEEIENELMKKVPSRFLVKAHNLLVLHGRHVCKAKRPECQRCPIVEFCKSRVN